MKGFALIAVSLFVSAIDTVALPLETLDSRADTIVTGTVTESRTLRHRMLGSAMYYVRLKVKVESIEKGRDQIRGAEFIEVRCWRDAASDTGSGHVNIPADGARFRVWLTRHEKGYFDALEPNGFELLDGSANRIFPSVERRTLGGWKVLGGLIGLIALCTAAFLRLRRPGSPDLRRWAGK